MKRRSKVLQAFSIIGPEEILNLSRILLKKTQLKKAAGDDLVFWDDAAGPESSLPTPAPSPPPGKVLKFPDTQAAVSAYQQQIKASPPKAETPEEPSNLTTGEISILHREISREAEASIQRLGAKEGYKKNGSALIVKTKQDNGKEKLHFASTNGVLVDKKSA